MELKGYIRPDGRVGFRNYIAVIPLTGCVQQIVNRIAEKVENAVALCQPLGCDLISGDQERLGLMLSCIAVHPNIGGVFFVTMGCAELNIHKLADKTSEHRPVRMVNMQKIGGTNATIEAGVNLANELADIIKEQPRQTVPISSILLGTKCGASDNTSYNVCNPVIGAVCDRLVDIGATVVLSENFELYPALEDLAKRAIDSETADAIRNMANYQRRIWKKRWNEDIDKIWGDPKTAHSRSIQRIAKAGTKPVVKVFQIGQQIDTKGLVILNAPNSDLVSITSMMASGCNILVFTTGIGTPVACPLVPTIKVTANPKTYQKMEENIDVLVTSEEIIDTERVLTAIIDYANGLPTKGELLGHGEMFIPLEGITF